MRYCSTLLMLATVAVAFCASGASVAQTAKPKPVAPKSAYVEHAVEDVPVYQVELNKGRLIRLNAAATSVVVADPEIADIQVVSPRAVYVHAKKIGETSIMAIDKGDTEILNATIEVTYNISKLQRTLKTVSPDADVKFRSVDGGLVLEGYVDTPQQSERVHSLASGFVGANGRVINMLNTVGSDQVMLQIKVAEVARTELERFGISINQLINNGNLTFRVLQGRTLATSIAGGLTRNSSDNSIGFGFNGELTDVNSVIDALQRDGFVSILAEPSLTTTSGKAASFLAGGEFPVPMVNTDGQVEITYRQFGINLEFTPTVLSGDKISLNVKPEVSNISSTNAITVTSTTTYNVPTLQTRRASTTVELGSGQSFMIAGLFKNDRNNTTDRYPGLGDLPVLGGLFRSHEFRNDQTELVIIATPYLVKPTDATAPLLTPMDGFYPPSDLERLLFSDQSKQQSITPEEAKSLGDLHGDGGFILE
jgi:pilus assembly protein CpaC